MWGLRPPVGTVWRPRSGDVVEMVLRQWLVEQWLVKVVRESEPLRALCGHRRSCCLVTFGTDTHC